MLLSKVQGTLFDRVAIAKKSRFASQPCRVDASDNSEDEEATDALLDWNINMKNFKSYTLPS